MTKSSIKSPPRCPYCKKSSTRITGLTLYPHRPDLFDKVFYRCDNCEAHVGCHPGTDTPLGRLADKALRRLKSRAHAAFDPIWRSGQMSRKEAYKWLAAQLGIKIDRCHIGFFNEAQCRRTIQVCNQRRF